MSKDTRSNNTYFESASISEYIEKYVAQLSASLRALDDKALERLLVLLDQTRLKGKTVWVGGNGGSFAIAEHLCCDWTKGLQHTQIPHLKVHSLGSNGPLTTAIANDLSYADIFSEQIKMFAQEGDVLMMISSSGNSGNVCRAAEIAKSKKMSVVSFTGFSGGLLQSLSDISIQIGFPNHGVVEDAHQIVMHVLAQFSYLKDCPR